MQNFSERLAFAIKNAGKPKGELANHCGVALSSVSRWLSGSLPRAEVVREMAAFLGVDVNWLLYGTPNLAEEKNNIDSSMLDETATIYRAKAHTQTLEEGAKNSTSPILWQRIAETAAEIAELKNPRARLKFSQAIYTMIEAANEKDQRTITE